MLAGQLHPGVDGIFRIVYGVGLELDQSIAWFFTEWRCFRQIPAIDRRATVESVIHSGSALLQAGPGNVDTGGNVSIGR